MRNWLRLLHGKNGNSFIRNEQGNSLMIMTWNTRTGEPTNDNETTHHMVACWNALNGADTKLIENIGHMPSLLAGFLEDWDRSSAEEYVEDVFPRWMIDLAGGMDVLKVLRNPSALDDEEESP